MLFCEKESDKLGFTDDNQLGLEGKLMTPKEECEELLNALLPFAANQLKKHGEFYPFGAVLTNDGEISLLSS